MSFALQIFKNICITLFVIFGLFVTGVATIFLYFILSSKPASITVCLNDKLVEAVVIKSEFGAEHRGTPSETGVVYFDNISHSDWSVFYESDGSLKHQTDTRTYRRSDHWIGCDDEQNGVIPASTVSDPPTWRERVRAFRYPTSFVKEN